MATSPNPLPPGTVSKILWHFTGGPKWNSTRKTQASRPKPAIEAFEALRGILSSKELRLGSYRELVKVKIATRVRKRKSEKWKKGPEKVVERELGLSLEPQKAPIDVIVVDHAEKIPSEN